MKANGHITPIRGLKFVVSLGALDYELADYQAIHGLKVEVSWGRR